jgi:Photosynthesis system II assembly factor YCF48
MDVVKKLVSGRLKRDSAAPHPDPELVSAFSENCLSERERAQLLGHLGRCAECRALLYLAIPDVVDAQPVVSIQPKRAGLRFGWATFAASVIILGSVLVGNRQMFTGRPEPRAAASPSSLPAIVAEQKAPPQTDSRAQAGVAQAVTKVRPPAKHMTAKPQATLQFDQSGEVHVSGAPLNRPEQPELTNSRSLDTGNSRAEWSLSNSGAVERSYDFGRTWQIVSVGDGLTFSALSSLGRDVWVGGSAGSLYHSSDSGQSWLKVEPIFESQRLQSDISSIRFSDAQNGELTTSGGEVWGTSDGGRSWRLK